jgi:hypothetical protein
MSAAEARPPPTGALTGAPTGVPTGALTGVPTGALTCFADLLC